MEDNNIKSENNNVEEEKNLKVEKSNKKRKKHNFFRVIINLLIFLLFVVVILGTIIGFKGYSDFKNGKEPKYYIDKRIENSNDVKKTIYDFGLYRAEKHEDSKRYTYRLVPFFLK